MLLITQRKQPDQMLYRAGFAFVYRVVPLPDHDDFRDTPQHRRKRTVLFATAVPIDIAGFRLCLEGHENQDPWTKPPARAQLHFSRASGGFWLSPAGKIFPWQPAPQRFSLRCLSHGVCPLASGGSRKPENWIENGRGRIRKQELHFVETLLSAPGMTVLDIGAITACAYACLCSKGSGARRTGNRF